MEREEAKKERAYTTNPQANKTNLFSQYKVKNYFYQPYSPCAFINNN
jgi:hypothetical protein